MAIYGTLIENCRNNVNIDLLEKSLSDYERIFESLNIVTESSIILTEGINFKGLIEKIKTYWNQFKTWFGEMIKKIKSKFNQESHKPEFKIKYEMNGKYYSPESYYLNFKHFYQGRRLYENSIEFITETQSLINEVTDIIKTKNANQLGLEKMYNSNDYSKLEKFKIPNADAVELSEEQSHNDFIHHYTVYKQANEELNMFLNKFQGIYDQIKQNIIPDCDNLFEKLVERYNNIKDESADGPFGGVEIQKSIIEPVKDVMTKVIPKLKSLSTFSSAIVNKIIEGKRYNDKIIEEAEEKSVIKD